MGDKTICECGHVKRMHTQAACRACPCNNFAPASDPQAAILAGITTKQAQVAAANDRRARALGRTP